MSGRPPIVQERLLPVAPAAAFRAWSDPESLRHWMCPGDLERAEVELDFQVGGRFRIAMVGAAQEYVQHGEVLEIVPDEKLVLSWVSEWMPPGERHTRLEVSFEAAGEHQTRLRLVHSELPEGEAYAGHLEGWASILEKLSRHLSN